MNPPPPHDRRTLVDWLLLVGIVLLWGWVMKTLAAYHGVPL